MRWLAPLAVLSLLPAASAQDEGLTREQLEQELRAYRRVLLDFGGLVKYGSDNAEIPAPKPGEPRVVFLGDDIMENWKGPFFPGKPYFNRGITRQTTAQMLVRFRQDVISLKPRVVVIQAGTNDLASVMGPATVGTMADNVESMVELARAHGIGVVLASVLPVCDCFNKQTGRRPVGKILGINEWLRDYAKREGLPYVDWHGALVEGRQMKREYTLDGFLPNAAGYERMAPLVEKAIGAAVRGKVL